MGFWICWYFLSLWVPNYTFQYRIHYHDATTSPPNPALVYANEINNLHTGIPAEEYPVLRSGSARQ